MSPCVVPETLSEFLDIPNAAERFQEALAVAGKIVAAGVPLHPNLDHAAIFTDPPYLVAGPLKALGYDNGWDARCYPSPVDGQDYINVSGRLPEQTPRRAEGWPEYVAVVHPVDRQAREHMLGQGYGNPFVHHLTWGIVPPDRAGRNDVEYASFLISTMIETRRKIAAALDQKPGTLIIALPAEVAGTRMDVDLPADQFQIEPMEGGGFLLQFFVLTGGRIELALRSCTRQTFNPKSVDKISRDEISAIQTDSM